MHVVNTILCCCARGRSSYCSRDSFYTLGRNLGIQFAYQSLTHGLGVANSTGEFFRAAMGIDELQTVSVERFVFVDVSDRRHQRTDDNLGVILEEIDLQKKEMD